MPTAEDIRRAENELGPHNVQILRKYRQKHTATEIDENYQNLLGQVANILTTYPESASIILKAPM